MGARIFLEVGAERARALALKKEAACDRNVPKGHGRGDEVRGSRHMLTAAHDDSMIKNLSPRTVHDASLHDEPPRKASGLRNRLAGPRNDGKPRQPAEAPTDGSRAGEDHSAAARDPRRGPSSCAGPVPALPRRGTRRASSTRCESAAREHWTISPRRRRAPDGPTRRRAREPEESREEPAIRSKGSAMGCRRRPSSKRRAVARRASAAAPCADDPVAPLASWTTRRRRFPPPRLPAPIVPPIPVRAPKLASSTRRPRRRNRASTSTTSCCRGTRRRQRSSTSMRQGPNTTTSGASSSHSEARQADGAFIYLYM